jgi:hypothetical protein
MKIIKMNRKKIQKENFNYHEPEIEKGLFDKILKRECLKGIKKSIYGCKFVNLFVF